MHLVAGEHDGVIPASNVRYHYAAMSAAGMDVSYRQFDFGHMDFTFSAKVGAPDGQETAGATAGGRNLVVGPVHTGRAALHLAWRGKAQLGGGGCRVTMAVVSSSLWHAWLQGRLKGCGEREQGRADAGSLA